MPTLLYHTDVVIKSRKVCSEAYQLFNKVTKRMICASFDIEVKDACEVTIKTKLKFRYKVFKRGQSIAQKL